MERIKRKSFKNALQRVGINNQNEFGEDLEIS